jgi:membrane protein involved in colicin uptake
MGKPKGGMNQKVAAAMEKKGAAQAVKDAKAEAEHAKQIETEWSKGANNRGASRSEAAATKADEQARKKREKAALLAEEEEALGPGGKAKKTPTLSKSKGKKKKNDMSLLEDALVSGAEKKQKAKKKAEQAKAEKLKAEEAKKKKEAEKPMDTLLANTDDMLRGTEDDLVGRAANKALDEENGGSGIDGALGAMGINGGGLVLSAKAQFKAYEERTMIEMKEDYPGLKLSQYKEKIFQKWKKSPENPANLQE